MTKRIEEVRERLSAQAPGSDAAAPSRAAPRTLTGRIPVVAGVGLMVCGAGLIGFGAWAGL